MGYRVEYGPVKKVRGRDRLVSRKAAFAAVCFLLFLVLTVFFWPEGTQVLRRLVFSGDYAVTTAAIENLTKELQGGLSLTDSLRNFCLRILEGAGLASLR